jgi:hypothetical protein
LHDQDGKLTADVSADGVHLTEKGYLPLQDANRSGPADGVARTPPMGYCTWNSFIFDFDEKVIRELADAMVSSGMKDAGYEYLMVDEPGFRTRDKDGNFVPDPKKYPGGMKALGDYLHARGLKFGIYTDAKSTTCGGFLGSYLDISGKWKARDLWAHKDLGEFEGGYSCEPAGHEMVVLRFSRIPDPAPAQLPSGGQK